MNIKFQHAALFKKEIKALYLSAFPRAERVPLRLLFRRARQGRGEFCAVTYEGEFIGLTFVAGREDIVTLMFFAISDAVRGRGFGGEVLDAVCKKHSGKRLFLIIEEPDERAENYAQRVRRKKFYLSHGFEAMDYTVREMGVTYEPLSIGGRVSLEEYLDVTAAITGRARYFLMRYILK